MSWGKSFISPLCFPLWNGQVYPCFSTGLDPKFPYGFPYGFPYPPSPDTLAVSVKAEALLSQDMDVSWRGRLSGDVGEKITDNFGDYFDPSCP